MAHQISNLAKRIPGPINGTEPMLPGMEGRIADNIWVRRRSRRKAEDFYLDEGWF